MLVINRIKTLRAARLSIAIISTFLITWYFQIPEGAWAIITCCFVLYEYTTLGGVVNKSYLRTLGTFLNALYGASVLYFFGNNPLINIIALTFGIFVNTYLFMDTKRTYSSVLGAVTLILVLINYNHLDAAILRPFNVILGEFICILTFEFVFPEYARNKIMQIEYNFTDNLRKIFEKFLDRNALWNEITSYFAIMEKQFSTDIANFNRYIEEARPELKDNPILIDEHQQSMSTLKHLYHLTFIFSYIIKEEHRDIPQVQQLLKFIIHRLFIIQSLMKDFKIVHTMTQTNELLDWSAHPDVLIFQPILEGFSRELDALEKTWKNITTICLNHHKEYSLT